MLSSNFTFACVLVPSLSHCVASSKHIATLVRSGENLLVPSGNYVIDMLNQSKALPRFIHKFTSRKMKKKLFRGLQSFSMERVGDVNRNIFRSYDLKSIYIEPACNLHNTRRQLDFKVSMESSSDKGQNH